jgi:hypothetical protein
MLRGSAVKLSIRTAGGLGGSSTFGGGAGGGGAGAGAFFLHPATDTSKTAANTAALSVLVFILIF